jgi:hypothetical protein
MHAHCQAAQSAYNHLSSGSEAHPHYLKEVMARMGYSRHNMRLIVAQTSYSRQNNGKIMARMGKYALGAHHGET